MFGCVGSYIIVFRKFNRSMFDVDGMRFDHEGVLHDV